MWLDVGLNHVGHCCAVSSYVCSVEAVGIVLVWTVGVVVDDVERWVDGAGEAGPAEVVAVRTECDIHIHCAVGVECVGYVGRAFLSFAHGGHFNVFANGAVADCGVRRHACNCVGEAVVLDPSVVVIGESLSVGYDAYAVHVERGHDPGIGVERR